MKFILTYLSSVRSALKSYKWEYRTKDNINNQISSILRPMHLISILKFMPDFCSFKCLEYRSMQRYKLGKFIRKHSLLFLLIFLIDFKENLTYSNEFKK